MWWVVVGAAVLVVLVASYLAWLTARVDRLHARAAGAGAAMDAQLLRRAVAVGALADTLEDGSGPALQDAVRRIVESAPEDRETAENDLTKLLRGQPLPAGDPRADEVRTAGRRVALARQVHTDLVRDALAVRRQRVVRLLRLAAKHPRPVYFDIEDTLLDEPADVP